MPPMHPRAYEVVRLYTRERYSQMRIERIVRLDRKTIRAILLAAGVEIRPVGRHVVLIPPDTAELTRLYHDEGMSLSQIARHYDVGISTVRRWFAAAGIHRRPAGPAPAGVARHPRVHPADEVIVREFVEEARAVAEIAERHAMAPISVRRVLASCGIPHEPRGNRTPRARSAQRRTDSDLHQPGGPPERP